MPAMNSPTSTTSSDAPDIGSDFRNNDVFISYSRKDRAFVEVLHAAFQRLDRDPWIDWDDIAKGEEWWKAIQRGIEAADTFIFVISPDSVLSSVCRDEIDHAATCNKRFLPIVRREGFDTQKVHPSVSSHNWLFFRETDDFDQAFQDLIKAIDTDLTYVRAHTRLLVRAIEWQNKQLNASYLLRGDDLRDAEHWLIQSVSQAPKPTDLQINYIQTSNDYAATALKARQKAKWIVVLTTVLANMLFVTVGCVWFYNFARIQAMQRLEEHLVTARDVGLLSINADEFQVLATVGITQQTLQPLNQLYQNHQSWLNQVHSVFPNAYLRTYIAGAQSNEIIWIGDNSRASGAEPQPQFRQSYSFNPATSQLDDGLVRKTVNMTIYSDDFGSWVSAYAPIQNNAGRGIGALRVDFRADYVRNEWRKVRNQILVAYIGIFLWLIILSIMILRVTQPRDTY